RRQRAAPRRLIHRTPAENPHTPRRHGVTRRGGNARPASLQTPGTRQVQPPDERDDEPVATAEGHPADWHGHGPGPVAGPGTYPVRRPPGHRARADHPRRRRPRPQPPLWYRRTIIACILAIWAVGIWAIIAGR